MTSMRIRQNTQPGTSSRSLFATANRGRRETAGEFAPLRLWAAFRIQMRCWFARERDRAEVARMSNRDTADFGVTTEQLLFELRHRSFARCVDREST